MPPKRKVYLLDAKALSPETIAATFAKTSRSPQSFDEIAAELTDSKSAEFHEKWVVGYGHASVAEHAIVHFAIENISRLAIETLESNRLASYTEKSSRYQVWDSDQFYIPSEINKPILKDAYLQIINEIFNHYKDAITNLQKIVMDENQQQSDESESAYHQRIRSISMDVCRYYLPAAAVANVGITINARALEYAICKMLSHPLSEVQQLGQEIRSTAKEQLPTLVKYADRLSYFSDCQQTISTFKEPSSNSHISENWCRIIDFDHLGEEKILAALLYRFNQASMEEYIKILKSMEQSEQLRLVKSLLGRLGVHDMPLREMEHAWLTIDLILDQGAYGELKRHRMMTQTPQPFSSTNGFVIPRLITSAGLESAYIEMMKKIEKAYEQIYQVNKEAAAYLLPNAFKRRVLLTLNLRSAYHLIKLRTTPNAHFAMRRVAFRIAEEIGKIYPLFAPYFKTNSQETWQQIESSNFSQV